MSAIANQPANKNFLSPLSFKFFVKKTPNVNWFVQSVTLPSIVLPKTEVSNPFINYPAGGDHLTFGDLEITFRVDEDMSNYIELYNWLQAMGFPDNFDQYKAIAPKTRNRITGLNDSANGLGVFSDASLMVLTSAMNPNIEITFIDLYPISISPLQFNTQLENVNYIEAQASFGCRKFNIATV
jgi:hypothetical protein